MREKGRYLPVFSLWLKKQYYSPPRLDLTATGLKLRQVSPLTGTQADRLISLRCCYKVPHPHPN